ncbi:MAG: guanylate kinase, partial [Candidatus Solibacter sp.]|nr:guanylate kinase [Candidatus Solibacter sp.]
MTTVFIISAPSGSGKSTLVSRLLAAVPELMFSVSYTTRKPRGQEVDGQSYRFV